MGVNAIRSGRADKAGFFNASFISDANGGTKVITTDGFFRPGVTNQGLAVTVTGTPAAAVTVFRSTSDPSLARKGTAATEATWDAGVSCVVGTTTTIERCTMMRLVFPAAASTTVQATVSSL